LDERPTVQRELLRRELRRLRRDRGLTHEQVTDALDWSISKLCRIESGTTHFSESELNRLLDVYLEPAAHKRGWLHFFYHNPKERSGHPKLSLVRLSAAFHTLMSVLLIATLMAHRHGREPVGHPVSLLARYRPLAGVAAAG
jgi:transcriptional regulator with XRE-family HTH domain